MEVVQGVCFWCATAQLYIHQLLLLFFYTTCACWTANNKVYSNICQRVLYFGYNLQRRILATRRHSLPLFGGTLIVEENNDLSPTIGTWLAAYISRGSSIDDRVYFHAI